MPKLDMTPLVDAAAPLTKALAQFDEMTRAIFARTLGEDRESRVYLVNCLQREEGEVRQLLKNFAYFDEQRREVVDLPAARRAALLRRADMLGDLERIFAADGHHAQELRSAMVEVPPDVMSKEEAARMEAMLTRIDAETRAFVAAMKPAVATARRAEYETEDKPMQDYPEPVEEIVVTGRRDDCCDAIVDAISRLQGQVGASAASVEGGSFAAFDRTLVSKLGLTLGIPDLGSDGARAMGADALLAKLETGLARSVIRDDSAGLTRYRFNPLKARGTLDLDAGAALGAQAVARQTLQALREPFVTALHAVLPETVTGDQAELDDLRAAAERGFDALVAEAGIATGAYAARVLLLLRQVTIDVLQLGALGGAIDDISSGKISLLSRGEVLGYDLLWSTTKADAALLDADDIDSVRDMVAEIGTRSAVTDRDASLLVAEANEAALLAMLEHLGAAARILRGDTGLGATLGRVRALNDAVLGSISGVSTALAQAGISAGDQAVTFVDDDGGRIDLGRLLTWIETDAQDARVTLAREDLNHRDMERIRQSVRAQSDAMRTIVRSARLPQITSSRFSLGRREIGELSDLLDAMREQLDAVADVAIRTRARRRAYT